MEESDDEYTEDVEKLLIEDDDDRPKTRKRKNIHKTFAVQSQTAKKQKMSEANSLSCDVCNTKFTRKDNLARHNRNKHK